MILSFMGVSVGVGIGVPVGGGGTRVAVGTAVRVGGAGVAVGRRDWSFSRCFSGRRRGGWQWPAARDERNRQGERDDKEQRRSLRVSTRRLVSYRFVASTNYVHAATLLSGGVMVKDGGGGLG